MAAPTKPTFIHYGDFDASSRKLPVMEFMERFRDDYDKGSFDPKWYTPDFTYVTPDGRELKGRDNAIAALKELYGPLPSWRHEATYLNCYETDFGHEMIGKAMLWVELPGRAAAGESKRTDGAGKQWDLAGPGAFMFQYVRDEEGEGHRLRRLEITADTSPIIVGMLKRGVLSPKDLGLE
jgi:hypothetical protein